MVHGTSRERRREATSERILEAAERILESEGSDALTMQRLAAELGHTVGATYRYFESKDAIVAALQRRVIESLGDDLEAALARYEAGSPRASKLGALTRVALVARVYASLGQRRPTHARLLMTMLADPRNVLPAGVGEANVAAAVRI
ncbi:MAG: TetR/AcrR family transcriptional regulator, partial [Myxococcota bacterium]|nr:TetR/AcrR family transcriptional regulator [Myxococcota bacterium]